MAALTTPGLAMAAIGIPSRTSLSDQGLPGVGNTWSSRALQPGEFVLGLGGGWHDDPSALTSATSGSDAFEELEEFASLSATLGMAAGLGWGLDAALSLPFYYESFSGGALDFARSHGQGDLSARIKLTLPGTPSYAAVSLLAQGAYPTATGDGIYPRALLHHPFSEYPSASTWPYGTAHPRLGGGLGLTLGPDSPEAFRIHGNTLFERHQAPDKESPLGLITFGLAAEFPLGSGWSAQGEARQERLLATAEDLDGDLAMGTTLSGSLSWRSWNGLSVEAGGIFGPSEWNPPLDFQREERRFSYRANPPAVVFLNLAYQGFPFVGDRDDDGIPNRRDRCPLRPEDKDGFEDGDGCPDIDNDRDRYLDSLDRCPMAAEDRDGFQDWDGCPDLDNDLDKVVDSVDACRNEAEDRDGYQDEDGCPDLDNDKDGIPDVADRCSMAPETKNGFADGDGCPEADRDRDGIPDKVDRCPGEAELINFYRDEDGCPDQKPDPVRNGIVPGVGFRFGGAELDPGSHGALDSLAAILAAYPGTVVEIQGHLDNRGGPDSEALSEARARSVADYLVRKGVEARRLKPVGYGGSRPIHHNRTALGRQTNRRIEIRRLN
ncbi:MAG TPA: OmpA family protein [Fibrobacteria bacterium]|nr:OmpA family protein [Fibrobacteria bacterium]